MPKIKKIIVGVILVILISLSFLFYWQQGLEEKTNLFDNFQSDKQNTSSFDKFQSDKSINREAEGEAGSLIRTAIDKIFASKGFQIKTRDVTIGKDRYMSDIISKSNISFFPCEAHFYIEGMSGIGDIYSDKEDVVVLEVLSETPAEKAGVKYKDQIIAVDDKKLRNKFDLINYVQSKENVAVSLRIERDNKEITLSVIPKKIYDERIGIGIGFWDMKEYIDMETIVYKNREYHKYSKRDSKFRERNYNASEFDNPRLDETLQWSNPMHYINYLRFYRNPKIIETVESEIKITFDVDLKYFIPADKNKYGDGVYEEISQIEGEISVDKNNFNPIQEKLKIIFDDHRKDGVYKKSSDITVDFANFGEIIRIAPPKVDEIVEIW